MRQTIERGDNVKHSLMHDLYLGRLVPWERGRSQDPDYTPLQRKISDIKTHFEKTLPPEEYKRFQELENLYAQSASIEDVDVLEYGMSMGFCLCWKSSDSGISI
jgi:hypothetical protein